MPPSGYTLNQSNSITEFLVSCSKSLEKEARTHGLSPIEALRKEVRNVDQIFLSDTCDGVSKVILELTKWFYNEILTEGPESFEEYNKLVEVVVKKASESILNIHVPSIVGSK